MKKGKSKGGYVVKGDSKLLKAVTETVGTEPIVKVPPTPTDTHVYDNEETAIVWSDGEVDWTELDSVLLKLKKRVVELTDVTITKEALVVALVKYAHIAGNEVRGMVDKILADCIMEVK